MEEDKEVFIDESLYSRQQIMMGEQAMRRMAQSSVFVSGFGGLGIEIAKNIALAGVKSLVLHDTKILTWLDLGTNFYANESNLGQNRAEICLSQIQELNPYVKCSVSNVDLNAVDLTYFDQFKCVILTDAVLNVQLRINDYCHSKSIYFISGDVRGVFSWAFCDFGEHFEVFDKNGEENKEMLIGEVSKSNPCIISCLNDERHEFEDGDIVSFREIKGIAELNGKCHRIKVISPSKFSIDVDGSSFSSSYSGDGIATQIKQTVSMNFIPLRDSLNNPSFVPTDFCKIESQSQLHMSMQALHAFVNIHQGNLPAPWNLEDAKELIQLVYTFNKKDTEKIDESLVQTLAFTCQGSIAPLTSFQGGVMAQECLKSLSGKYLALYQWMYFDAREVVPPLDSKDISQFQSEDSRFASQVICLGRETCARLSNLKLFMIGCGAIGCEMLKNYAMLGVSTGSNGQILVTDHDLIEKSNLNRQFLFRSKDIHRPKSEMAAKAVRSMNPAIHIVAHINKVGPDTETIYSDRFFSELDLVVNALDNVSARLYVDQRCVTNRKPLLESGTLGPKGHVQVILPFKTESYGSQRDPPEKDIPFCTLKSFPNQIEHCIEWARDFAFGGLFFSKPMQWNQLVDDSNLIEKLKAPNGGGLDLKIVRTAASLLKKRPRTFSDCVEFARIKFEQYYVHKTLQLLHNFPLDHKTDDKGTLFWSSPKRPPTTLKFDWNDKLHRQFIVSMASLWAQVWGIVHHNNLEEIEKVISSRSIPSFTPKSNKRIVTDETVKKNEAQPPETAEEEIGRMLNELTNFFTGNSEKMFKLNVLQFEKDDDRNFHVDFISAAANLRARMYSIPEVERLKVKAIAGRIMPAIATTTAAVAGCVSLELVKLVKGCDLTEHKNLFMNLALPLWAFSEPGAAERKKITGNLTYTIWDSWEVKEGDITVDQFLKYFEAKYGLQVSGIFKGAAMVYVPMFPGHSKRKTQKVSALLKNKSSTLYEDLIVTFNDEKGEDICGPPVRFYF